ncbi:MAG: ABC transporter permease [Leptospiraceae bacterium]|nr:MAG: ABC transporter permease [Leptospiraceae bacterium]
MIEIVKIIFKIAFRNLIRNKKRTTILIIAASIACSGATFIVALMNGLYYNMYQATIDAGPGHLQIRPKNFIQTRKFSELLENPEELKTILKKVKINKPFYYSFRLEREGILRKDIHSTGIMIYGIDPEEKMVSVFDDWLIKGEFNLKSSYSNIIPILIGKGLADEYDVDIGDRIVLTTTNLNAEVISVMTEIKGIFQTPSESFDKSLAFIDREALSKLISNQTHIYATSVVFNIKNPKLVQEYKNILLNQIINIVKEFSQNYALLTYEELQPALTKIIEISQQFNTLFYAIFMFAFAFTLFESILISVFERTREIGIIRAIGGGPIFIFLEILIESLIVTISGILMGFIISYGIILYFYFHGLNLIWYKESLELLNNASTLIRPYLTWKDVSDLFFISVITSILAAAYPGYRAIRLNPVEAIYNKK